MDRGLNAGNIQSAATAAAKSLEMATQAEDADRIAHAIELPALVALARGETPVARQLFVQMVALAREYELSQLSDALAGLATVSGLDGDLLLAVSCRDELRALPTATRPRHQLARALVDLLDNRDELAAITATQVRDEAERFGHPYVHLLSLELLAACGAGDDPRRARDLLNAAADERASIGAKAWPLDPYRHTALRRLATATMPGAQPPTPS